MHSNCVCAGGSPDPRHTPLPPLVLLDNPCTILLDSECRRRSAPRDRVGEAGACGGRQRLPAGERGRVCVDWRQGRELTHSGGGGADALYQAARGAGRARLHHDLPGALLELTARIRCIVWGSRGGGHMARPRQHSAGCGGGVLSAWAPGSRGRPWGLCLRSLAWPGQGSCSSIRRSPMPNVCLSPAYPHRQATDAGF